MPVKNNAQDPLVQNYSPELLMALHVLTREGQLNQDSRRKLKQIEHLTQLCYSQLIEMQMTGKNVFRICDVGAGKNYFSFLLWDRYFRNNPKIPANMKLEIYAVESRQDLSDKSKALALKLGFTSFHPITERAENVAAALPEELDLVIGLHACDTATDDAILLGLQKKAQSFALVPCCQAEVARLLEELPKSHPAYSLWRHPIHRREFGSHLTNVIRSLYLESHGYKVRCTEFVGLEHTLKNEVILAEKVQAHNGLAEKALRQLLQEYPVLQRLIKNDKSSSSIIDD